MTANPDLIVEREKHHIQLTFNRPECKNAINLAMYETLAKILREASTDDEIVCVIFAGTGDCFSAGNDINDFLEASFEDPTASAVWAFLQTVAAFDKPLIAAVHGAAVGIGTTLLLHCDFVYASPQIHCLLPFIDLALCPEFGASLLLPQLIGRAKANEMLMLGQAINSTEAQELGLVNAICDDPLAKAKEVADSLTNKPLKALINTKRLLKKTQQAPLQSAMEEELNIFAQSLQTEEFRKIAQAFLNAKNKK